MIRNKLLDNHKINMTIMSVIDGGENLFRAPPAYVNRIIRDGDIIQVACGNINQRMVHVLNSTK